MGNSSNKNKNEHDKRKFNEDEIIINTTKMIDHQHRIDSTVQFLSAIEKNEITFAKTHKKTNNEIKDIVHRYMTKRIKSPSNQNQDATTIDSNHHSSSSYGEHIILDELILSKPSSY